MVAESIPFKYGNKNSKANVPQISIKCTDADGKENKEECPIFTNGTQDEVLIQTIETIIVLGNRYDWKDGKEKLYYQNFGRALKGEPSKKWESLIESVRIKNHDHAWSKCPNNPISKNFAGKLYTEIPASERYTNDFSKKAEKMASDEKETKKKSSKSGDLHFIQKTPMVTIREEFQDLEYESDDEDD
jgi:hypothetical protein